MWSRSCEETPPFMRATTFASMDTPGPFEKVAKEAYFNVTLPGSARHPHRTWKSAWRNSTSARSSPQPCTKRIPALHSVSLAAAGSDEGPQAARRQYGHRRLGALLRADDARRRLRPAGSRRERRARGKADSPWPTAGRATAQRAFRGRHSDASPAR